MNGNVHNVVLFVHVLCIIAGLYFGAKKGRTLFGFLMGCLGVLGLIILMFFSERKDVRGTSSQNCQIMTTKDSDNQATMTAKTFGNAPRIVQVVSVLLIIDAVVGILLNLSGKVNAGAIAGQAFRIYLAYALAHGAVWARNFILAAGLLVFCGGLMGTCFLDSGADGKLFSVAVSFLVGGAFNLLMGSLLCIRSAREWFASR